MITQNILVRFRSLKLNEAWDISKDKESLFWCGFEKVRYICFCLVLSHFCRSRSSIFSTTNSSVCFKDGSKTCFCDVFPMKAEDMVQAYYANQILSFHRFAKCLGTKRLCSQSTFANTKNLFLIQNRTFQCVTINHFARGSSDLSQNVHVGGRTNRNDNDEDSFLLQKKKQVNKIIKIMK